MNMGLFKKIKPRTREEPVSTGRVSSVDNMPTYLSPYRSRSTDLQKELRSIPDEANAIEFITKKTPDASMSLWNFLRLSNQGHQMKFYSLDNKEVSISEIEEEWREFAKRINGISNSGLDGLIDIFHKNGITFGNQMCEVEVSKDRKEIVDVYPIDPRTVHWEWEERNGKKVVVPYQYSGTKKNDLSKGNFFYVPLDPDSNDPKGTLIFAPALQAVDSQLQTFNDVHAVLHHQGYARDFYSINLERALQRCPPATRNDPKKFAEWLVDNQMQIQSQLQNMNPDSDIVAYDDVSRDRGQGGTTRSVDFRAINELTDVQMNNGLKQLSTFTNRHNGKTETYSSVEMKIFVQGIMSLQRGSKRLVESIATLWLRIKGIQAIPVFTHNVVDWQSELDKEEVATSKLNRYAVAQLMRWIDGDTAAQEVMGAKKSVGEPSENIKVSFSVGGEKTVVNDKHSGQAEFDE